MSNQRKESRKKLMAFTPVYDEANKSLLGYIGNLNMIGMMVVSEHQAQTGQMITLSIELPQDLSIQVKPRFVIPARVIWCKQDDVVKSYTIGFGFRELTPLQSEVIQAVLDRYHFRHHPEDE